VPGSKKLVELSASEQDQLCEYIANLEHGYIATCVGGIPREIPENRPCGDLSYFGNFSAFDARCTATVDDTETCYETRTEDPCDDDIYASCHVFWVCLLYLGIEG
jgi:hypothetical protein